MYTVHYCRISALLGASTSALQHSSIALFEAHLRGPREGRPGAAVLTARLEHRQGGHQLSQSWLDSLAKK